MAKATELVTPKFKTMEKVVVSWTSGAIGVGATNYIGTVVGYGNDVGTYRIALPFGAVVQYAEKDISRA